MATHEPPEPDNWPLGHVSAERTDDDIGECFLITIHGEGHYLHASTAAALRNMLILLLKDYNDECEREGLPGV